MLVGVGAGAGVGRDVNECKFPGGVGPPRAKVSCKSWRWGVKTVNFSIVRCGFKIVVHNFM